MLKIPGKKPTQPTAPVATEPAADPSGLSDSWKSIISTIAIVLAAFILALIIKGYLIQPYVVDGQSMEPTLQNSDRLLVNKVPETFAHFEGHQYVPARGSIIVFNKSGLPGYVGTKQLIKRVIGLPGERVVVKDGKITIYNTAHPHGFNPDTTTGYTITAPLTQGALDQTLGPSQLFVCGDNRDNSEDSRFFGPIDTNDVVGKLAMRIMPLGHAERF